MKKLLIVLALSIGAWGLVFAQNLPQTMSADEVLVRMYKPDTSFYAICEQADAYLAANPDSPSFAKKYARWKYYWETRVDEKGSFATYNTAVLDYVSLSGINMICTDNGDWHNLEPVLSLQESGILKSVYSLPGQPNTVFVGYRAGGLWRTTDNGDHWTCITDQLRLPGLGINYITGNPNNPNEIYAATGNSNGTIIGLAAYGIGVLKSTDGGNTWSMNTAGINWQPQNSWAGASPLVNKIIVDPTNANIVWAISDKILHKSADAGINWTDVFDFSAITIWNETLNDMEFLPNNANTLFISTTLGYPKESKVFVNTNANTSPSNWVNITPNGSSFHSDRIALATTQAVSNALYASFSSWGVTNPPNLAPATCVLMKTTDNGANWTILNNNISN